MTMELILDHASNLNWIQAYESHILQKADTNLEGRKQAYASVTAEEITELARTLFTRKNMVVTVKGKKSKKLEQDLECLLKTLDQE